MNLSWKIVRLNLKESFSIAYGSYSFREALIVSLKSNNYIGYGECTSIDYYHINLLDFVQKLEEIKAQIESHILTHPKEFYIFLLSLKLPSFLRSAIDCAYWDLFGKLENKSFLEINAIAFNSLPESSITISVDTIENQIDKIKNSSWKKFKVKCHHYSNKNIKLLLQLNSDIALDSNGSYTINDCLELQNEIASSRFTYLEQPMKKGVENYKVLNSDSYSNWMADEDCQDATSLEQLKPHYKSINIKLVKCGGLTPAIDMVKKARTLDFKIMIGCMTESSIGISAGAVLASLCDFVDLDGANLVANDIAKGSQITNGQIQLSEKPGLGIELL